MSQRVQCAHTATDAKPLLLMSAHAVLHYNMSCGGNDWRALTKGRFIPGEAESVPVLHGAFSLEAERLKKPLHFQMDVE